MSSNIRNVVLLIYTGEFLTLSQINDLLLLLFRVIKKAFFYYYYSGNLRLSPNCKTVKKMTCLFPSNSPPKKAQQ